MGGLASGRQLRRALARRAAVTIPVILLLGFAAGRSVPAGADNPWYVALAKPDWTPPDWVFPVAWSVLYVLTGLALAMVIEARGARGRARAIGLFAAQFALNLAWTPVFFGARQIDLAFAVLAAMLVLAIATTVAFARIRRTAAWLMLPYLVWIGFAGALTWRIGRMNPDPHALAPRAAAFQMSDRPFA